MTTTKSLSPNIQLPLRIFGYSWQRSSTEHSTGSFQEIFLYPITSNILVVLMQYNGHTHAIKPRSVLGRAKYKIALSDGPYTPDLH